MTIKPIRIFCDGAGQSPDGKRSGYVWLREDTRQSKRERMDGLTNNEAEYRAVLSALKSLRPGATAEILTDAQVIVSQLRGEFRIREPRLDKLATEVKTLVEKKRLTVIFTWIRREQNRAGKLL